MRPAALLPILLLAACAGPERHDEVGSASLPGGGTTCPAGEECFAPEECATEDVVCPAGEECFAPEVCADETRVLEAED